MHYRRRAEGGGFIETFAIDSRSSRVRHGQVITPCIWINRRFMAPRNAMVKLSSWFSQSHHSLLKYPFCIVIEVNFSSLCNCAIVSMSYPLIILSTKPLFATIWHSSLFARDILACVRSNTRCQEVNKFITITCSEHFFGLSLFAIFHEEIVDFVYDVINSFL